MVGEWRHRLPRMRTLVVTALLACVVIVFVVWQASSSGARRRQYLDLLHDDSPPVALDRDMESRIVGFCSDCHALPRADSFPREAWHDEVIMGYNYFARLGRNDLDPPPISETIAYFQSRAPEHLAFPQPEDAATELHAAFKIEKVNVEKNAHLAKATSNLRWARLEPDDHGVLLACDMRDGVVAAIDLRDRTPVVRVLARLENPCHVEPCDLDGDQVTGLLVADLGSYFPRDHDLGRVIWLRRQEGVDSVEEIVLASGLGRVADVRPADFDGDGDLDLIVAEFGAWETGSILLLKNVAAPGQRPRFEPRQIDPRPGTIHVPVLDLNGDGRPDFLALISQEYERVEAFLNQGDLQFHSQILWEGPDLTFGSSGIEPVDLDQDGDMDVLYTNGDVFDNHYLHPSHGIQWLENLGDGKFAYHRLTDMLGAYRALAGDIDLDGDLEIVAAAWLPPLVRPPGIATASLASIVCLEQTQPGVFVRHTLKPGSPYYATLELADFDGDGDLDFAVGSHVVSNSVRDSGEMPYSLAVWWNQVISTGKETR